MLDYLASIEDLRILLWYKQNWEKEKFNVIVLQYINRGYLFDVKSGLLRKKLSGEIAQENVYLRPTNYHFLEGVGNERLLVRSGTGLIILGENYQREPLSPGKLVTIPENKPYAFRPDKNTFLEIRLYFEHSLKEDKTLIEFYKFSPWVEYFS